jgi:hypothetical protein
MEKLGKKGIFGEEVARTELACQRGGGKGVSKCP